MVRHKTVNKNYLRSSPSPRPLSPRRGSIRLRRLVSGPRFSYEARGRKFSNRGIFNRWLAKLPGYWLRSRTLILAVDKGANVQLGGYQVLIPLLGAHLYP
jgi:hypothetical protein